MNCLIDYIGLKVCPVPSTPESGIWLNDFLPGVEWKQVDQIADVDQVNYVNVWRDIQARAAKRFNTDIIAALQNRFAENGLSSGYKLKQITQTANIGRIVDTATTYAPVNEERGASIELSQEDSSFANSNLQVIHIQSFSFYSPAVAAYTFLIKDLDTGLTLSTKTVAASFNNGWNIVLVNETFSVRRLSITFTATLITSVKLDISQHGLQSFSNSGMYWDDGCCSDWGCGCGARVQGIKGADIDTGNTYGVSVIFSVKCTYDNLICNNKNFFSSAWCYLLGAELMRERIYSSRINRWTTVDQSRAKDLRKEFEVMYKGGELDDVKYTGELNSAVYGIDLDQRDCCIECDAPVTFRNITM